MCFKKDEIQYMHIDRSIAHRIGKPICQQIRIILQAPHLQYSESCNSPRKIAQNVRRITYPVQPLKFKVMMNGRNAYVNDGAVSERKSLGLP